MIGGVAMAHSPKGEIRIFFPKYPGIAMRPFVNKPVTVEWWKAYFRVVGKKNGSDVHEARWYGHVLELNMQIPEEELLKPGHQKSKGPSNV